MPQTDSNTIPQPFDNAEQAWFWYCQCQISKNCGESPQPRKTYTLRPCGLDDIYICVVRLSLAGILKKRHINTLIKYGDKLYPPDPRIEEEAE